MLSSHQLVTGGAFAVVRHPIYAALLGLLLATGLAQARRWAIPIAMAVYLLGTTSRGGREEALLRGMFGADYDAYATRVPRLLRLLRRRA